MSIIKKHDDSAPRSGLNSVSEIIDDIAQGKMVILMDDEDRENEGDLVIAAEKVTAEHINFMARYARGLICLTLTEQRCRQLDLSLMVSDNGAAHSTNFTLSIEAAEGVTTGISAADRATTVLAAVAKDAKPADIVQPGHIFPLMAQPSGVLSRAGHTEAGCDLARLAGLEPASVIVEIMNDDGTMARRPELEKFAKLHGLKMGTIADLIQYRALYEKNISPVNERMVDTEFGEFCLKTYFNSAENEHHFALVKGDLQLVEAVPVRVHVGSIAKDVFSLTAAEQGHSGWGFKDALARVAQESVGVVVYIASAETSADIEQSIESLLSGQQAPSNPNAAYKQIGTGSQILQQLGVKKMRLMSSAFKFKALSAFDLEVVEYLER
ncbi:bifunctional 3,4-dihydroxy-2-butanone-4-phosphate synthase/GTP cyclohydrolase II [Reinekea thalattae]|uniref:3,4-dihydroxy-2-butanone 4-phosphate synthase n=1 Tax=Reinekea thalattae TaxID=2593301 RepID=A0A5C8ZBA4_9GAMM|nr:bifunctional 3,4-dihydroxy-2-butanone-4-phosphate synthase/GTP cyclohydrolase II [Reinekea thalattae]TXR54471.1 3,4-dihydroxy-2-butanone-4-phosphate synthase [Reinekea thalattae]